MAIYAISDVHTDYPENLKWLEDIPNNLYINDTVIIAGDITDNIVKLEHTLKLFLLKFKCVFFCPGNHELWINNTDKEQGVFDSLAKFEKVINLCKQLGVKVSTEVVDGVTIVPLFAWHDSTLHVPNPNFISDLAFWSDTYRCVWPENFTREDIAKYFVGLNTKHIPSDLSTCGEIITFSHFFPSKIIMKEYIAEMDQRWQAQKTTHILNNSTITSNLPKFPNFSLVAGTQLLENQILQLNPNVHIFGHSHRKMTIHVGKTCYINQPLGYPHERKSYAILGPFEPYKIHF